MAEALATSDPNNSQSQGDLSISYGKLGDVSLRTGATAKSLKYYQKGLDAREALARTDPDDSQAQRDLSVLYSKLGDVSLMTGGTVEASWSILPQEPGSAREAGRVRPKGHAGYSAISRLRMKGSVAPRSRLARRPGHSNITRRDSP